MKKILYVIKNASARKIIMTLLTGARSEDEIYIACHGFKDIAQMLNRLEEQNIIEKQQLFDHKYYQIHPNFKKTFIRKVLPLVISSVFALIGTFIKSTSSSLEKKQNHRMKLELRQIRNTKKAD